MKDWKKGECDLIPGKTAPHIMVVERDYPATTNAFTSIGPLMEKIGNGGKRIAWNTQSEMDLLRKAQLHKKRKVRQKVSRCSIPQLMRQR